MTERKFILLTQYESKNQKQDGEAPGTELEAKEFTPLRLRRDETSRPGLKVLSGGVNPEGRLVQLSQLMEEGRQPAPWTFQMCVLLTRILHVDEPILFLA